MDPSTLTTMSRQALTDAQAEARRRSHNEVETWHLLHALLAQDKGIVPALVEKLGLTVGAMQLAVERELDRLPKVSGSVDTSKVYVTQAVNEVFTRAEAEAKKLKDEYVSVEHLFLGLLDVAKPETFAKYLKSFGMLRSKVLEALKELRGNQRVTSDNPEVTYAALEKYGIDLVGQAKNRARRRDSPDNSNPFTKDEEQSGADRRTGSGQNGDRRRFGPADCPRRRTGGAEG